MVEGAAAGNGADMTVENQQSNSGKCQVINAAAE